MTVRATFGDFAMAARAHLDEATAEEERAAWPLHSAALISQAQELVSGLRAATDVMGRYLTDVNIRFGAIFDRQPGQAPVWLQAGFTAHAALRNAAAVLDELQQSYGQPTGGPESRTAGQLLAAASAMRYGRDLLHTHYGLSPKGYRPDRSEWAPVIASVPVTRAVMLEVGLWADQTARIAHTAAVSARSQLHEAHARRKINAASQWLRDGSVAIRTVHHQAPRPTANITLLHAVPINQVGPRRTPGEGMTVSALCEGTVNSAERIRHLARRMTEAASWAPGLTRDSLHQSAACAAVIGHHCQVLLRTLADRETQLPGLATGADLLDSADSAGHARQTWLKAARSWNTATTSTHGALSAVAVEAADLALWTGRLAYANPRWTLSLGPSQPARTADQLIRHPADFAQVITAVHQACETITQLAATEHDQIVAARQAFRLLVTTRSLPDKFDVPHPYAVAPKYRIDQILASYRNASTASAQTTDMIAKTAVEIGAPSRILAAARAATRGTPARSLRSIRPKERAQQVERQRAHRPPGPVEQSLRDLGVVDSAALGRATEIDQAAEQLILWHSRRVAARRPELAPDVGRSTATAQLANRLLASSSRRAATASASPPRPREPEAEPEP
jgi:hypothetical protein